MGGEHAKALVVAVQARAVKGVATEAALRALAGALGVRRQDVRLISGASGRTKVVEVSAGVDIDAEVVRLRSAGRIEA